MDYIVGDQIVLPSEETERFVEKPWRLPGCYICFATNSISLEVADLPALKNKFITFGSFNSLIKINEKVILFLGANPALCSWITVVFKDEAS